jgi:MerR family mercuric resistance operon transcriptional regulator
MDLTIKRFAEAGGVGVETVRFYQRRGLLAVPENGHGVRRYGDEDVRRLRFIRKAQRAGFTLEEIRELIELDSGHDRERARAMATVRLRALDAQIAELIEAQSALRHLADRCAHQSSGPCPILAAFDEHAN